MSASWLLQGNPRRWDDPDDLYTRPITSWCVTGVQRSVEVGDDVLLWMADRDPERRGVHAVGRVAGPVELRENGKPFVALAVDLYVTHDPVSVLELRGTAFGSHPILTMARRTAYPCTRVEFDAALRLVLGRGPTPTPTRPAA
jgi:hypothetical protein